MKNQVSPIGLPFPACDAKALRYAWSTELHLELQIYLPYIHEWNGDYLVMLFNKAINWNTEPLKWWLLASKEIHVSCSVSQMHD